MIVKLKYASLIILPVFLFLLANYFTAAVTPYYLNDHFDPAYIYLLNSLNLAQLAGFGVGSVVHPGTSLQVLGAIVIRIYFAFSGGNKDMVLDVLHRPESYLLAINFTMVLLSSLSLFVLGVTVYKIYKNIIAAYFLQFTIFFSCNVFLKLSEVTVENLLIFVTAALIIISLKFINEETISNKKLIFYLISFSIICGLGISTKLNFIPMMIIPLFLIPKAFRKIIFILITILFFLIFVFPAISNYSFFFDWVTQMFTHDGIYGSGEQRIINLPKIFFNIKTIFATEKFFTFIYLLMFSCLILKLIFPLKQKSDDEVKNKQLKNEYLLLSAIFIAISFQIIIVAKHFLMRYMLPSLLLSLTGLFLVMRIFSKVYFTKFKRLNLNYIYLFFIAAIILFEFNKYRTIYDTEHSIRDKYYKMNQFIDSHYPGAVQITGHMSWNEKIALFYATQYAGKRKLKYRSLLSEEFPDQLLYVQLRDTIYNLVQSPDINKVLTSGKKIIFQSNYLNSVDTLLYKLNKEYQISNSGYNKVYANENSKDDIIYELNLK